MTPHTWMDRRVNMYTEVFHTTGHELRQRLVHTTAKQHDEGLVRQVTLLENCLHSTVMLSDGRY
jgi:hypothetical protein